MPPLALRPCVLVCSPFRAATRDLIQRNIEYARNCMIESIARGESPFLSHLLYPQSLDDTIPECRLIGLQCEQSWLQHSVLVALYIDHGITEGMAGARDFGLSLKIPTIERRLFNG